MKRVYFSPTHFSDSPFDGATHKADVFFYRNVAGTQNVMEFLGPHFDRYRSRVCGENIIFTADDLVYFFAYNSFESAYRASLAPRNNGFPLLVIENIAEL